MNRKKPQIGLDSVNKARSRREPRSLNPIRKRSYNTDPLSQYFLLQKRPLLFSVFSWLTMLVASDKSAQLNYLSQIRELRKYFAGSLSNFLVRSTT